MKLATKYSPAFSGPKSPYPPVAVANAQKKLTKYLYYQDLCSKLYLTIQLDSG